MLLLNPLAPVCPPHAVVPGPVEFHPAVLEAAGRTAVSHMDPRFRESFGEALELFRAVAGGDMTTQPFVLSGSGTLAWDLAASNPLSPGDRALLVNTGYFGDRFGDCFNGYRVETTHLRADFGSFPSLEALEKELTSKSAGHYALVSLTHVDTSTGVLLTPEYIRGAVALVRKHSPATLVSLDAVCSLGGEQIRFSDWDLDLLLTASQKALGTPPGLCLALASARAVARFEARTEPVWGYFNSWANWIPIMKAYEGRKPAYFATPAVGLILALRTSLRQLCGLPDAAVDARTAAHAEVSRKAKKALVAMGLKLVPQHADASANTMTAAWVPEGVAQGELVGKLMGKGVVVAGGLIKEHATKYFRIGHMNISSVDAHLNHIAYTLHAVQESLEELGYKFPAGYARLPAVEASRPTAPKSD
ncbi:pyridoxal phosphate-dependent transferase [Hyaloraphidium curvatum]|nr:pyridoxal phosphate-dependent transferase [Hyaloraphidium curvatum]